MASSKMKQLAAYRDRLRAKLSAQYSAAESKAKTKLANLKADQEQIKARTEQAMMNTGVTAGTAAILGYGLEAYPRAQYLDKGKKVETHALLAVLGPVAGGAMYISGREEGEAVMQVGLTCMSTFVFKKAAQYARDRAAA